MPHHEFHTFAAAYGWSWPDYEACPTAILPYLHRYIGFDRAVEERRTAELMKARA